MVQPHTVTVYVGNAYADGEHEGGWILGHFLPPGDPRHSADVEVKWGVHPPGDTRARWAVEETRTAVLVLVSGSFVMLFRDREVVLDRPGDYVLWGPGEDHSWRADTDAVVLTVRWPSVPGYRVPS